MHKRVFKAPLKVNVFPYFVLWCNSCAANVRTGVSGSDFRVKWPSLNTENDGFSLHLFLSHTTFGEEIGQAISKSLEVCTFQTYVCVYALMHVDICG